MRILYLAYAPQNSFTEYNLNFKTGFGWIDTLIEEIAKIKKISIALAIPVNSKLLLKNQNGDITIYGIPQVKETNVFRRFFTLSLL